MSEYADNSISRARLHVPLRTAYTLLHDALRRNFHPEETVMLHYAVVFLVIAIIAAILGFGGIAAGAVGIAKVLFLVFLVLAVVAFVSGRSPGV
jgi:uncharacterized membrane protein YtjA (UPF0391 family)